MLLATQWATDIQLELELKSALDEGRSLSTVAPILISAFESGNRSKRRTALRFLQLHPDWKNWQKDFEPWLQYETQWPWDIILSWLTHQSLAISLSERRLLFQTIEKQKLLPVFAKYPDWNAVYPIVQDLRNQARIDIQRKILEIRDLLFEELRTWKSQRLREQEIKVLKRLKTKFPSDPDIQSEIEKFKQSQAIETLGSRLRSKRNDKVRGLQFKEELVQISEEWEKLILDYVELHPESTYDLTIACCFMEDWVTALKLANKAESCAQRDWLELEILLKLGRYIDVLQALHEIELRWAHEGETFFATAYIRAQALYGLGQREKALEILESLLASRPLYRQGVELLHMWRGSPS